MKKSKLVKILAISAIFTSSVAALAACGGNKHELTLIGEQAATCTEDGHRAYYMCSHCDDIFADAEGETKTTLDEVKINKLEHDLHKQDAEEATCTKPGHIEYWTCSREEGKYFNAQGQEITDVVTTKSHDFSGGGVHEFKKPTTEAEGSAAYWQCNDCHNVYVDENGDKQTSLEALKINKIKEDIDGTLTESFYSTDNAYAVGGSDLQSGGIGFIMNGSLCEDGIYMHVTLNHNLSAAEQTGDHGKLGIIWMIHNEDDLTHPALGVCLQQYGVTELMLDGTVKYREPYSHQLYYFNKKTNESGAATKYTTTWEFFITNADLAEMSNGAFADAFETKDGKTTLKKGYNVLVNAIGNMTKDADESDKFSEIENVAWCESMEGDWYRWWKAECHDGDGGKNMVLYQDGFSAGFRRYDNTVTVKSESQNATVSVAETVQFGDSLNVTVTPANGYIIASVLVNGKTYQVEKEGDVYKAVVAVNGDVLKWNQNEITVTPVTVKEVKINGTITATDVNGDAVSGNSLNGTLKLIGENYEFDVTVTNGAFTHTVYADEYEAFFYGYKISTLNVNEQSSTVTLTLEGTIAYGYRDTAVNDEAGTVKITGSGCPQDGTPWSGYAEIVTDQANADKSFEFTVKDTNVRNGAYDFAARRIAIQVAGNSGFFFWFNSANEVCVRHLIAGNIGPNGAGQGVEGTMISSDQGWMKGIVEDQNGDGLQFRIVRTGEKIILNAYNSSKWVRIGETSCGANDKTNFVFYAQGDDYEFSAISVKALQHKTAVNPAEGNNYTGNVEYYFDGANYYTADGSVTTLEGVTIKQVDVTLAVTAKELDGTTPVTLANGAEITLTGKSKDYTYTVGGASNPDKMLAGTYEAYIYGYAKVNVVVPENGGNVEIAHVKTIAYGYREAAVNDETGTIKITGVGCPPDGTPWSGYAEIVTDGTNADKSFGFTVKDTNVRNGQWDNAARRIAIQVAGNSGFFLWFNNDGEVMVRHLIAGNIGPNGAGQGVEGAEICHNHGWMKGIVEDQNGNGLTFRIARIGTKIVLNAFDGSVWRCIGETSCGENDKTNFVFYAQGDDYEFSAISVNNVTLGNAKAPSASEAGNVAYYTDGTNYYTTDGRAATLDALTLPKLTTPTYTFDGSEDGAATTESDRISVSANGIVFTGADESETAPSIKVTVSQTFAADKDVEINFNVKKSNQINWAGVRFGIEVVGTNGMFVWNNGTSGLTCGIVNETMQNETLKLGEFAWFGAAIASDSGANIKLIRKGGSIRCYAQNGSEWVYLGSVACSADDDTQIKFIGKGATWTVTDLTVSEIEAAE